MKNKIKTLKNLWLVLPVLVLAVSCERDLPSDAPEATFPNNADVFVDNPVGLTDEFFESFDPAEGYNTEDTFDVVNDVAYEGTSSIRIDVPSPDNPNGFLAGGIFRDRGDGRNLTGYDALTFWAKASTTATLASVGFGADFEEDNFTVVRTGIQLTTNWTKYVIPIPDPSKLVQQRGLFSYIAAPYDVLGDGPNGNEIGWTFWIDEIRYENLGTNLLLSAEILNGQDQAVQSFTGDEIPIPGCFMRYSLGTGENITLETASAYFEYNSTDEDIVDVNNRGQLVVGTAGTATVNATIDNVLADGSVEVTSTGTFVNAPDPTLPVADVLSVYSDTYSNLNGLNIGAFNNGDIVISTELFQGNEHIAYGNLQFVGVGWNNTVDVSGFTTLHVDVQLTSSGSSFVVELLDYGPDDIDNGFGDGSAGGFNATSELEEGAWVGVDIPLNNFLIPTGGGGTGLTTFGNIGNVIFVSNGGSFLIDNVYFY